MTISPRTGQKRLAVLATALLAACTSTAPVPATTPPTPAATPVTTPSPSSSPTQTARPTVTLPPTASPSPAPSAPHAPTSPAELDLRRSVVPMAFPFARRVAYRYGDNFLQHRGGRARWYNHVSAIDEDGTPQRAHDGVDIFVARGTPVLAVFDGVVVDPDLRWRPWNPARYGTTAVVVSLEPGSTGYAALYMHLDRIDVEPGDRVVRGEVLGAAGSTGNAIGSPLHLHFELRAPFRFTVEQAGLERQIDAFNPYPSLVSADPKAADD